MPFQQFLLKTVGKNVVDFADIWKDIQLLSLLVRNKTMHEAQS